MSGIYVASKVKHAPMWRKMRDRGGPDPFPICSTWIDEARDKQSPSPADLWRRCVSEAANADAVIPYVEPGEVLKGALVEVGAALARGVPVFVVGEPDGSWASHPLVRRCASLDEAQAEAFAETLLRGRA